jgi:hypothetical protein
MARRGRKRKAAAREPSGRAQRAQPVDLSQPTPELQARRLALLGASAHDAKLSPDCPLDILLARRLLTPAQHRAGWTYAALSWGAAGKPFPDRTPLGAVEARGIDLAAPPDESAAWCRRYDRAKGLRAVLMRAGARAFLAVERCAVRLTLRDRLLAGELADIRRGLDALDAAISGERRAIAA